MQVEQRLLQAFDSVNEDMAAHLLPVARMLLAGQDVQVDRLEELGQERHPSVHVTPVLLAVKKNPEKHEVHEVVLVALEQVLQLSAHGTQWETIVLVAATITYPDLQTEQETGLKV